MAFVDGTAAEATRTARLAVVCSMDDQGTQKDRIRQAARGRPIHKLILTT